MNSEIIDQLRAAVRDVPNFPKPGILFKDITPILSDGSLFRKSVQLFAEELQGKPIDKIVGIEARGFLFGAALAYELGIGFIPIRKRGKLPYETRTYRYDLEYGQAEIEMHLDAIRPGEKIALIDDVLATGGTAAAAINMLAEAGASVSVAMFLIELEFLKGRAALGETPVLSFLKY